MMFQLPTPRSPLLIAATVGRLAETQALVDGGADVNAASTREHLVPLHGAAEAGDLLMFPFRLVVSQAR
jgi:hypothetical protein